MSDSREPGPVVPLPAGGPPPAVLIGACVVLGLGLFALLEGKRHQAAPQPFGGAQTAAAQLPPSAPPLQIPPPAPTVAPPAPPPPKPTVQIVYRQGPSPPPVIQYVERPAPAPPPQPVQAAARLQEPALVIDLTDGADTKGADAAVRATVMRHRSLIIPQGTIIPAVLETPINSSTPGLVRAITSKDTHGFDGARVLIPKGSRLFGEYQSDAKAGQSRVLFNWTNLVRPDGVSIRLNSPAGDRSGGTGVPGAVNNHLLARFTSAVLQTALEVGPYLAYQPGAGSVIVSAPIQTATAPAAALIPTAQAAPTITVKEGADIAVVVAHDLDFSGALPRP